MSTKEHICTRVIERTFFKILGPLPIGTKVKIYDKRFKKGWYVGKVKRYFRWYGPYFDAKPGVGLKYGKFSYVLECRLGWIQIRYVAMKHPMEVIEE